LLVKVIQNVLSFATAPVNLVKAAALGASLFDWRSKVLLSGADVRLVQAVDIADAAGCVADADLRNQL